MTTTTSDHDAAVAVPPLQAPQLLAAEPLPFWFSEYRWLNPPPSYNRESNVKTLWETIATEYGYHYQRSIFCHREDEIRPTKVSVLKPTIADFTFYVKKRISPLTPPEQIPLTVLGCKISLGGEKFNKDAVGQVVRAMLERLWTGTPPYIRASQRLKAMGCLEMAKHSPMFGLSACGEQFRRVIILNVEVGYIDSSSADRNNTYLDTEWPFDLSLGDHQRVLDLHFQLMDRYSRFINNLKPEDGIKAYGDANDQRVSPAAALVCGLSPAGGNDRKPEAGRRNRASRKRPRPETAELPRATSRAEGQASMSQPTKGEVVSAFGKSEGRAGHPDPIGSSQTGDSTDVHHTSATGDSRTATGTEASHLDVAVDNDNVEAESHSSDHSIFDQRKPPLTKEEEAHMDAMLRPMWTMTYEERKAVFGVVGEGWEAFAEAYIGYPAAGAPHTPTVDSNTVNSTAASELRATPDLSERPERRSSSSQKAVVPKAELADMVIRPMSSMPYEARKALFGVMGEGWEKFAEASIGPLQNP
jgi:hypothetical protein